MVTETVTGAQIPLDAAYIANLGAQNNLTARGQDISVRGQDVGLITSLAQFQQAGQMALQEYYNNVATIGLEKARGIYEQRLARAQLGLQAASEGGNQRASAASLKLQALQMLADRRGPQNWVGYDYLLGKLGTPTGQAVDPTTFADSIVDPRFQQGSNYDWGAGLGDESLWNNVQNPQMADFNAAANTFQQAMGSLRGVQPWQYTYQGGGAGGAGGGSAAQIPPFTGNTIFGNAPRPAQNISGQAPEDIFSGVRNQDVAGLKSGDRALITTGTAGPSKRDDYTNFRVFEPGTNREYQPGEEIKGGVPIWLQRLAGGGPMRDKMAIVGEGATADDLGKNGEIIINWTGAPIDVLKNEDARAFIERMDAEMEGMGEEDDPGGEEPQGQEDDADEAKSGEVTLGREMKKYGKGTKKSGFLSKLANYADGTVDPYQLALENKRALEQQTGAVTPEMRAFAASRGLGSNLMYADGQLHYQRPDLAWESVSYGMPGVANGEQLVRAVGNDPAFAWARAGAGQYGASGPMGAARLAQMQGQSQMPGQQSVSYTPAPGQGVFGQSAGSAAAAGSGQTTVLDQNGDYGMPQNDLHIKYDPATIGNQPFIQNLKRGQRATGLTSGFGAKLSNSRLGIEDAPSNINLQGWRDSDSSQQQATQDLYEQGLAVDFGDIFKRAQHAAPAGVSTGRKRYGL